MRRSLMVFLPLVLTSAPVHAYLLNKPHFLVNGYENVYLNPKDIPFLFAITDHRMSGLSGPERLSMQVSIMEESWRRYIEKWNSVAESTAIITYGGLTDLACSGEDDISVVCWSGDQTRFVTGEGVIASGLASHTLAFSITDEVFVTATDIYLNTMMNFRYFDAVGVHELGHLLGFAHSEVRNSVMHPNSIMTTPQPDDIAGLRERFAFPEECAPLVTEVDGRPQITTQIYLSPTLYKGDLGLSSSGTHLEVVEGSVVAGDAARGERSCALKPETNGALAAPLVRLGNELHRLELQMEGTSLKIMNHIKVKDL